MTLLQDPCGALQSYAAVVMAFLVQLTESNAWSAVFALLTMALLVLRLYKEVKGVRGTDDGD